MVRTQKHIFSIALAVACALVTLTTPRASELRGPTHVVDGDTLYVAGVKVRLFGIDAPETDQLCLDKAGTAWRCGIAARDRLARKIGQAEVSCEPRDRDKYGRIIAVCRLGSEDIDSWLVRSGLALAYVQYAKDYVKDEQSAKAARAGLWDGAFINPWDWRHRTQQTEIHAAGALPVDAQRLLVEDSAEGRHAPECVIKGNVNAKGERIYHVPGQRYYQVTKMDKGKGERWFCTEDEARAAGWRRSNV